MSVILLTALLFVLVYSASSLFDMGFSVIMALPCVDPEGGQGV